MVCAGSDDQEQRDLKKGFEPKFSITNRITACLTRIGRARGFLEAVALSEAWVRETGRRDVIVRRGRESKPESTVCSLVWLATRDRPVRGSRNYGSITDRDMGYSCYFVRRGREMLILLAGGDKRTIARARGMSQIAGDTGLGRESLYKALSPDGNPEFATVLKVVRALGLKLHAEADPV